MGMAYDQKRREVVLFGGYDPALGYIDETWIYDGSDCKQERLTSSPPPLVYHAMCWDQKRQVIVLCGRSSADGYNNSASEWDGSTSLPKDASCNQAMPWPEAANGKSPMHR